ncbi:hypothetical protein BaRGS_00010421 [Batillaria attramentaria]|uniref:Uncharacterized protein n=1 Tax=Batillaria attramentaria TaxID=370345 RepID=A0ABD0LF93_9CAEN
MILTRCSTFNKFTPNCSRPARETNDNIYRVHTVAAKQIHNRCQGEQQFVQVKLFRSELQLTPSAGEPLAKICKNLLKRPLFRVTGFVLFTQYNVRRYSLEADSGMDPSQSERLTDLEEMISQCLLTKQAK